MIQQIRLVVLIPHAIMKQSKRPGKADQERKVQSTCFAHFQPLPSQGRWVSLGIGRWYKPPTRLPFLGLPSVITRHLETAEQGSSFASCRACHSFTQAHHRVSKVNQKTSLLGEQRTRAPSVLTLSWRILDEPSRWKVITESWKTLGFLASGREEFNLGPVMRTFV